MREVRAALFMSVDGVAEDPHTFQFDHFDEDMFPIMDAALADVDDVVMGRVTYDQWSQYWPPMGEEDFGAFINPVRKHVASHTLTSDLEWDNATVIEGDLLDFVRDLKSQDGGAITVTGSLSVVRQLFLAGLLDRLTLMIHPVLAGSGKRLFDGEFDTTRLELVDHTMTRSGNAVLTYSPRQS